MGTVASIIVTTMVGQTMSLRNWTSNGPFAHPPYDIWAIASKKHFLTLCISIPVNLFTIMKYPYQIAILP
jgi:hypothetical protein